MIGWLLVCAGMVVVYGLLTMLQGYLARRRAEKDRDKQEAAWLRRYNTERLRRWKGARWWQ